MSISTLTRRRGFPRVSWDEPEINTIFAPTEMFSPRELG